MRAADTPPLDATNPSWRRFLDTYEPLRPDLYRYCRHLTRTPWDAEDMAQDTLARAFVSLGVMEEPPHNPRAWLFRIASNLWLNHVRKARELPLDDDAAEDAVDAEPRQTREAAGTLIAQLAPQERVAVVLKDAFGLSIEEIAEALTTTSNAIKAALHRGRGKLVAPAVTEVTPVTPNVLDAFCDAFNARDLDRLTALLLDTAILDYPGLRTERGKADIRAGTLTGTLLGCPSGGYAVEAPLRCEARAHRGETLLLWWVGDEVHTIVRAEITDNRISRLRTYYHSPDVMTEVCRELAVPFRTHGYHPTIAE